MCHNSQYFNYLSLALPLYHAAYACCHFAIYRTLNGWSCALCDCVVCMCVCVYSLSLSLCALYYLVICICMGNMILFRLPVAAFYAICQPEVTLIGAASVCVLFFSSPPPHPLSFSSSFSFLPSPRCTWVSHNEKHFNYHNHFNKHKKLAAKYKAIKKGSCPGPLSFPYIGRIMLWLLLLLVTSE